MQRVAFYDIVLFISWSHVAARLTFMMKQLLVLSIVLCFLPIPLFAQIPKAPDTTSEWGIGASYICKPFCTAAHEPFERKTGGYASVTRWKNTLDGQYGYLRFGISGKLLYMYETPVLSSGIKFSYGLSQNSRARMEVGAGLAHPYGDFGGDVTRGEVTYLTQQRTPLMYELNMGLYVAANREKTLWIGTSMVHLSSGASCGIFALHGARKEHNPGVNLFSPLVLQFRW